MLIIYGHGLAFEGLKDVSLTELASQLANHLPERKASKKPLDILWFNSCFMATIEVVYHLRNLATYQMASEAAEFTAGAPFQTLRLLDEGPDDVQSVAKMLAENYLESYSVKEKGSQSKDVLITSATIAVIESDRLRMLVDAMGWVVNSLKPMTDAEKETLKRSRKRVAIKIENASMMIDLGSFLRYLKDRKDRFNSQEAQARLDSILHLLELEKSAKVKTNPRLTLYAPAKNSRLVYGYDEWTRGHKDDLDTLALLPNELKFDRFVKGANDHEWPSRNIVKRLTISPFAPGLNHFDWYFEGSNQRFHRERSKQDFATFEATHVGNPIRFSGYTQERGKLAEIYTGLTVLD
ncbi:MAG: clostripain-related cysteine peptidase, partial [Pirellula sp.]